MYKKNHSLAEIAKILKVHRVNFTNLKDYSIPIRDSLSISVIIDLEKDNQSFINFYKSSTRPAIKFPKDTKWELPESKTWRKITQEQIEIGKTIMQTYGLTLLDIQNFLQLQDEDAGLEAEFERMKEKIKKEFNKRVQEKGFKISDFDKPNVEEE